MKFYITNFYNVRFLTPNQIPFSTAIWDPKWYHDFQNQDYIFQDKNDVWNGLRIEPLHPDIHLETSNECIGCDHKKNGKCGFIEGYKKQLESLKFNLLLNYFNQTVKHLTPENENPEIVLLVHETIGNPCSERHPLKEYFKQYGIELIDLYRK